MKRKLLVAFVATAALAVVVAARAKPSAQVNLAANNPGPAAVNLAPVKSVKSAPREEITGALQPAKGLSIGFEVGGRLARILVKKGAPVGEGQVIAQLDPELADAQMLQAEAAVKAAEAQSALAADTAHRQTQLQQSGSVSEWQGKSASSQATAAAAQLQAARAQLAQARVARRRHDLKAPFSGVLIDAPDQVGATVVSGGTLFTLEQLDPLVLKLTVSDAARSVLKLGTRVHVQAVSGGAASDEAWVRAVIPSPAASRWRSSSPTRTAASPRTRSPAPSSPWAPPRRRSPCPPRRSPRRAEITSTCSTMVKCAASPCRCSTAARSKWW